MSVSTTTVLALSKLTHLAWFSASEISQISKFRPQNCKLVSIIGSLCYTSHPLMVPYQWSTEDFPIDYHNLYPTYSLKIASWNPSFKYFSCNIWLLIACLQVILNWWPFPLVSQLVSLWNIFLKRMYALSLMLFYQLWPMVVFFLEDVMWVHYYPVAYYVSGRVITSLSICCCWCRSCHTKNIRSRNLGLRIMRYYRKTTFFLLSL